MMYSKPFSQPELPPESGATSDRPNIALVFLLSFLIMAPWPLIAFGLCTMGSIFEQSSDFILLFGGVTLLFMIPLGLLGPPEWVFSATIGLVWLIVLFLPVVLVASQRLQRRKLLVAYVLQAVFSAIQAGLGLLMLAGRQV
jgi:Flp pilus assembly protein TadB